MRIDLKRLATLIAILLGTISAIPVAAATLNPQRLVLMAKDLPSGFSRSRAHPVSVGVASKNLRWRVVGFRTGWDVEYLRPRFSGIDFIDSLAGVFVNSAQAHKSFQQSLALYDKTHWSKLGSVRSLGSEAQMYSVTRMISGRHATYYVVVWRSNKVRATLDVSGVEGTVNPAQAVRLAKKQQARILGSH